MQIWNNVILFNGKPFLHNLVERRQHNIIGVNVTLHQVLNKLEPVERLPVKGVDKLDVVGLQGVVFAQVEMLHPLNLLLESAVCQFF